MQNLNELHEQLRARGIPVRKNVVLAKYATFSIGGPAALLIEPRDANELIEACRAVRRTEVYALLLGRGSNVLLPDEGIAGAIIRTPQMQSVTVEENTIRAEAGVTLSTLARTAQRAGLTGLEFAYGIPGTLGGALYMNAGAYGGEMAQLPMTVRVYDAETDEILTLTGKDMAFSYRHSRLQGEPERTVLDATLTLTPDDPAAIDTRMEDYMSRRRAKQPLEYPSAGSTFKRPAGAFAGALIERSALKGVRVGGAMVSPKHAGFIVNTGGATAEDVKRLIEHVRTVVKQDHGVELETEVQILTAHLSKK